MLSHSKTLFNYFVRDLCILFLKWETYTPDLDDSGIACKLLSHLMNHVVYESGSSVYRSNLQLIKLLFEKWRDICGNVDKVIGPRSSAQIAKFFL